MYGRDGEDYLIVASNGGSDRPPLWYLNLRADPEVELRVGTERFPAVAATLPAEEKARVWPGWWSCSCATRSTRRAPSATSRWSG